jgi:hypothetical protein
MNTNKNRIIMNLVKELVIDKIPNLPVETSIGDMVAIGENVYPPIGDKVYSSSTGGDFKRGFILPSGIRVVVSGTFDLNLLCREEIITVDGVVVYHNYRDDDDDPYDV